MLHNIMLFYLIIPNIKMYTKKATHNGTEVKSENPVLPNYEIIANAHFDTFRIHVALRNRVQRKQLNKFVFNTHTHMRVMFIFKFCRVLEGNSTVIQINLIRIV